MESNFDHGGKIMNSHFIFGCKLGCNPTAFHIYRDCSMLLAMHNVHPVAYGEKCSY
jgi:hypothetical protein